MNPSAIVLEFVIKKKNLLEQAVDDDLFKYLISEAPCLCVLGELPVG